MTVMILLGALMLIPSGVTYLLSLRGIERGSAATSMRWYTAGMVALLPGLVGFYMVLMGAIYVAMGWAA